jgi:hypothetical protein
MKLERITFGPLHLRSVGAGKFRALTQEEVKLLRDYVDNHDKRITGERQNRQQKAPAKKTRKRAVRTTVEVDPIEGMASHDLTGQRRKPRKVRRSSEHESSQHERETDSETSQRPTTSSRAKSNHPAIVKPAHKRH